LRTSLSPRHMAQLPLMGVTALALLTLGTTDLSLVRPQDVSVVLLVLGAIAVTGVALGWRITGDSTSAGLIGLAFLISLGTMGSVSEAFRTWDLLHAIGGELTICVIYTLAFTVVVRAVRRASGILRHIERGAIVGLAALVVMNAGRIVTVKRPPRVTPSFRAGAGPPSRRPDIFLIVIDKYTGSSVLRDQYGFDNNQFEQWLTGRGFVVPSQSHTNYTQTFLVLASLLNVRYLDDYPRRFGRTSLDWAAAYREVENNQVAAFLQGQGYEYIFIPSVSPATRRSRYADRQIPDPRALRAEYLGFWYRGSAFPILHRLTCASLRCAAVRRPYLPESAEIQEQKLDALASLAQHPRLTRPRFVLAHLLLPHEPYIFRADCSTRLSYWPEQDDGPEAESVRAAYVDQIRCLNQQLMRIVEAAQSAALVPPVILIQADHGHGRMGPLVRTVDVLRAPQIEERQSIFSAYLLPGVPDDSVPSSITPVNAMRLVLRRYFGADLPPLKDALYWSPSWRPYDFVRLR
jgi:hypothetical protein